MALEELYSCREILVKACNICDQIEESGCWKYTGKVRMRDSLIVDLYDFCHYLASSDGVVTQREAAFFNTVLGVELSTADVVARVENQGIYSVDFEQQVPVVIRGAVAADRKIGRKGYDTATLIASLFSIVGKTFVSVDGIEEQEIEDLGIYMDTINSFIKKAKLEDVGRVL